MRSILCITTITVASKSLPKRAQSNLLLVVLLPDIILSNTLHWKSATKVSNSERFQFYSRVLAVVIVFPVGLLEYILIIVLTIRLLSYSIGVHGSNQRLTKLIRTLECTRLLNDFGPKRFYASETLFITLRLMNVDIVYVFNLWDNYAGLMLTGRKLLLDCLSFHAQFLHFVLR